MGNRRVRDVLPGKFVPPNSTVEQRVELSMASATALQTQRKIADGAKLSSHPRADDLIGIDVDLARTMAAIRSGHDVLERE